MKERTKEDEGGGKEGSQPPSSDSGREGVAGEDRASHCKRHATSRQSREGDL